MDKSSSDHCQDIDDGSWDLEDEEEVEPLEIRSSNSWDTSSDEGKRETRVEAFEKNEFDSENSISVDRETGKSEGEVLELDSSRRKPEDRLIVEDLDEMSEESVWRIPVSVRSESSDEEREIIRRMVRRKSRSCRNVVETVLRAGRSKSFGDLTEEIKFFPKDALLQYEGRNVSKEAKLDLGEFISLGDSGNHFQEIECRTLIMKKDQSESDEGENSCRGNVPVSSKDEASSLPDIAGTSRSETFANHEFRKATSFTTNRNLIQGNVLTESWILLDEMGQSQPVTITEVNFLLNGRSADAVLQENKEHFIPKSTVVRNANSDLRVDEWNPLVEESLQHFLNEDTGGEGSTSKSIRLERKFGNMLLYIQSGINLTSSVRFIPVDTEMIHMWRQSKETMSPISSEDDARLSFSENATEETSEWENPDDVPCEVHKPGPSVKKNGKRGKIDECENRSLENRRIIESLTDEIKQLRMRLDSERCRSSGLEQENHNLRDQLDKCKSSRSNTVSRKTKSEMSEDCDKGNDKPRLPEVSSSSLLSIEEFKDDNIDENLPREVSVADDRKNFKQSLDRKLIDIEEILKCKSRNQGNRESGRRSGDVRTVEETSGLSSSASVNTCAVADTNSVGFSETTGSTDSWFQPKKAIPVQRNISEVINDLEKDNERLVVENTKLKTKLNEISLELDEYVGSCANQIPTEDGRQAESLRNQVCNLKLELENMKSLAKNKEQRYKLRDAIVREELAEKSVSLDEWKTSTAAVLREIEDYRNRLTEMGLVIPNAPSDSKPTPRSLLTRFRSLTTGLTEKIADFQKENSLLKRNLKETIVSNSKTAVFGLERSFDVNFMQVPGLLFGNLSKEKGEDYYSLLSEKSVLEQEIKNLRKENDLLLEYQLDHNERLKKATASLKEEKARADSLENAAKLMEIEKGEISQALVTCQKEKAIAEGELQMEATRMAELRGECERRRSEMKKLEIKLQEAMNKCRNLEETFAVKEVLINELKSSCSQLETRESVHNDKIQFLTEQLKKLHDEKSELEDELRTTKQIAKESSQGMSEYISHLEAMVSNAEDSLSEMKEKCNETVKSLTALRREHEELGKQNSANLKVFERTKEELEKSREIINDLEENQRKSEETKRKALSDLTTIVKSEREKTETLEKLLAERKILEEEISAFRAKAESNAKTKDRLLKEQKDFINQISILKKEKEKLSLKYRMVKTECNERTKLLRVLDGKLKKNLLEYNKRIACLERNVSNIIEKAVAYKDTFLEKRTEVNAVVQELKEQLDAVYMEKRGLETEAINFQEAVKQLQREINESRKEKAVSFPLDNRPDNEMDLPEERAKASTSNLRNEELENRLRSTETELTEAKERNRQLEEGKEEEKKKYEFIIADLKNQISRYQVRLEVMLNNISTFGKACQEDGSDKWDSKKNEKVSILEERINELTEELEKKRKRLLELTEVIENNESAMRRKEDECESLKEKVLQLKEEIKSMKNQFSKLQEFLNTVNQNVETYQKERDEVAGKLAKSLKLIVEERASKQSSETIFAEKEKMFKDQLEQLQANLLEKRKEYESLLKTVEEKKSIIEKLQEDVNKWKSEVGALKAQVTLLKNQNRKRRKPEGGEDTGDEATKQNISSELKEIRAQNLEMRKSEGNLQAKIVRLEDELRGARLLIKELEGDLKSEKTSKKLLKGMITSATEDIERFKRKGHLLPSIADKIERHFKLSEVQSRELFSDYRTLE